MSRRRRLLRLRGAVEHFERLVAEDRVGRHAWRPSGRVPFGCPEDVDPAEVDFAEYVFPYWSEFQEAHATRRPALGEGRRGAGRDFDEDSRERLAFAVQKARMRYLRTLAEELRSA